MLPPPLIQMLSRYWGLDERQARRWWQAVARARWSVVRDWRQTVLLFDQAVVGALSERQAVDAVTRFLRTRASPVQVVQVLEALAGERLLRRQDVRQMESKVLAQVTRDGQWK